MCLYKGILILPCHRAIFYSDTVVVSPPGQEVPSLSLWVGLFKPGYINTGGFIWIFVRIIVLMCFALEITLHNSGERSRSIWWSSCFCIYLLISLLFKDILNFVADMIYFQSCLLHMCFYVENGYLFSRYILL